MRESAWEHLRKERSWQREQLEQRPRSRTRLARCKTGEGTSVAEAEGAEAGWLDQRPDQ